ncbi:MAG: type II toxin-antitoxin system PemK/MazF family toxin [Candidatus Eremiobacteraeota bacterium]|nr:type II toxin-antitoxin system PemK/MazF family toxin [Candidatus Eremiobacteraeota bacterium]NNM99614.1 type II toxin-antitoxin system PemK/MazF family toxin [Candidatus Eremiobacteraeota bacterium]
MTPDAGSIVLVDWRSGALAQEPNKIRPAVVISNAELFPESYPNVIVVPLTSDQNIAHPTFSQRIEPTSGNGATRVSWALAHHVTSVAKQRIAATTSRVDERQLQAIREQVALAIGR